MSREFKASIAEFAYHKRSNSYLTILFGSSGVFPSSKSAGKVHMCDSTMSPMFIESCVTCASSHEYGCWSESDLNQACGSSNRFEFPWVRFEILIFNSFIRNFKSSAGNSNHSPTECDKSIGSMWNLWTDVWKIGRDILNPGGRPRVSWTA